MHQRLVLILIAALLATACSSVNQSIEVGDGEVFEGSLATVNGSIQVGNESTVTGSIANVNGSIAIGHSSQVGEVRNVNGPISIGARAIAASLETVNGSTRIGESARIEGAVSGINGAISTSPNAHVAGELRTVNGAIRMEAGSRVLGKVATTNGSIRMDQAEAGAIETRRGTIEILNGSVVSGSLRVPPADATDRGPIRIVIGANSRVAGPLEFEREVALYVHQSAAIGEVIGAEVRPFSGEAP